MILAIIRLSLVVAIAYAYEMAGIALSERMTKKMKRLSDERRCLRKALAKRAARIERRNELPDPLEGDSDDALTQKIIAAALSADVLTEYIEEEAVRSSMTLQETLSNASAPDDAVSAWNVYADRQLELAELAVINVVESN